MHYTPSRWPVENQNSKELIVVIDTNVLISFLWGSKTVTVLMDALFAGRFKAAVSDDMLHELLTTIKRGKFAGRFNPASIGKVAAAYKDSSLVAYPRQKIAVSVDIKDNIFLECAVEANADYLITGDDDLLRICSYKGIHIVKPAVFLRMTGI